MVIKQHTVKETTKKGDKIIYCKRMGSFFCTRLWKEGIVKEGCCAVCGKVIE